MKKIPLLSLALASGAILLMESGCTTVNTVENAVGVAQPQMVADKRVITDTSLNNAVRVIDIKQATSPGGFLKIQLQVKNIAPGLKKFSYRVEWFDENAMMINLPTASSLPVSIEGGEIVPLTCVAPTPLAKDFRIKFIEPVN